MMRILTNSDYSRRKCDEINRVLKMVNSKRTERLSILLELQGIGCMSFAVGVYIPLPLCCYISQRYGHVL